MSETILAEAAEDSARNGALNPASPPPPSPAEITSLRSENRELQARCRQLAAQVRRSQAGLREDQSASHRHNRVLLKLAREMFWTAGHVENAARTLTEAAAQTLEVDRVGFWKCDELHTRFRSLALYDRVRQAHGRGRDFEAGSHPGFLKALENSRLLASGDLAGAAEFQEWRPADLCSSGVTALMAAPIRLYGRVVGVLLYERKLAGLWSLPDQHFAAAVADLATLALETAERQRSEQALGWSEARFQVVARATNDAVWEWDLTSDAVWWSEGFQRLFGHLGTEKAEGDFWDAHIHPADRERVTAGMRSVIRDGGTSWSDEYRFRRADGSYAHVLDRACVLRDKQGKALRMIGGMSDVTERKEAAEALRQAHDVLEERVAERSRQLAQANRELKQEIAERKQAERTVRALLRISRKLNSTLKISSILDHLLKEAIGLAGAESGCAGLRQGEEMVAQRLCRYGRGGSWEYRWKRGQGWAGRLLASKSPLLLNDADQDRERDAEFCQRFPIRSVLSVPVQDARGEVLGFFEVYNKAEGFGALDLQNLVALARLAAGAIQNALAYQKSQQAERALRQAQAGLEQRVSARTAELARANESLQAEINQRRQIEESLRRVDAELTDFVENAAIGLHWSNQEGTILWANQAELQMFGYPAHRYIGRNIAEFFADPAVAREFQRRLLASETVRDFAAQMRCHDGSFKDVLIDANGFWDKQRFVHSRCFMRDVTEHQRAEEAVRQVNETLEKRVEERTRELARSSAALQRSERRLRQAQQIAHLGSWEWDTIHDVAIWSEELYRIFGLKPETPLHFEGIMELFHPDDRERCRRVIQQAMADRCAYSLEHRIVRPDGTERYLIGQGKALTDDNGRVVRLVGVAQDMTDRLRAEQANRLLMDATHAINQADDFDSALAVVLRLICQSSRWEMGEVWVPSPDGAALKCAPVWHCEVDGVKQFRKFTERLTLRPGIGLAGRAWELKKPLWFPDLSLEKDFFRQRWLKRICIKAAMAIPVLAGTQMVAVMVFFVQNPRVEDGHLVELVSSVASQLGALFQHKQAEQARLHLATLVECSDDAIIGLAPDGTILSWNRGAERSFGYPSKRATGRPVTDLAHPAARGEWTAMLESLREGRTALPREMPGLRADGSPISLLLTLSAIRGAAGELRGASLIARDMTQQKRLEKAVLEISEREQRRIGQDIHDGLSQQLAGAAFLANVLQQKLGSRGVGEAADMARVAELLNETAELARLLARGLFPVRLEANGLMSALQELTSNIRRIYRISCRFICRTPVLMPDNVTATHLYRIVQEAVHNAIKHGQATRVTVELAAKEQTVILSVRDNGRGFPQPVPQKGLGLESMDYRARSIGAILKLQGSGSRGTLLTCTLQPKITH